MEFIFLAQYVHYETQKKNFLRFFLPFFSSKLALGICPFPLPFLLPECRLSNGCGFLSCHVHKPQ